MLRITQRGPLLELEGRLAGAWVAELERLAQEVLASGASPVLDLSRVVFVDVKGHALLEALVARGAEIRAASRFVAELLRRDKR